MVLELKVPVFDANSEKARLVELKFKNDDPVQKDDLVAIFETSKSVYEFEAPENGFIRFYFEEDEELEFGVPFAILAKSKNDLKHPSVEAATKEKLKPEGLLSMGVRLELKKKNIPENRFQEELSRLKVKPEDIKRHLLDDLLQRMEIQTHESLKQIRPLSTQEKASVKSLHRSHETGAVYLWVNKQISIESSFRDYVEWAEENELAGTLFEWLLWTCQLWASKENTLFQMLSEHHLMEWNPKAISLVMRKEDGHLILPTLPCSQPLSPRDASDHLYYLKKRLVCDELTADDFKGGGLLLSVLENADIQTFQALPAPDHSFALAINDFKGAKNQPSLSLTLTYDHRLVTGFDAAKLLNDYCDLLQNWKKLL